MPTQCSRDLFGFAPVEGRSWSRWMKPATTAAMGLLPVRLSIAAADGSGSSAAASRRAARRRQPSTTRRIAAVAWAERRNHDGAGRMSQPPMIAACALELPAVGAGQAAQLALASGHVRHCRWYSLPKRWRPSPQSNKWHLLQMGAPGGSGCRLARRASSI
jgi:hypothetical protein